LWFVAEEQTKRDAPVMVKFGRNEHSFSAVLRAKFHLIGKGMWIYMEAPPKKIEFWMCSCSAGFYSDWAIRTTRPRRP